MNERLIGLGSASLFSSQKLKSLAGQVLVEGEGRESGYLGNDIAVINGTGKIYALNDIVVNRLFSPYLFTSLPEPKIK